MPVGIYLSRQVKLVTRHRSRENHYLECIGISLQGCDVYGTPTYSQTYITSSTAVGRGHTVVN